MLVELAAYNQNAVMQSDGADVMCKDRKYYRVALYEMKPAQNNQKERF